MSLHIYTSRDKVPEGIQIIDNNDMYFTGYTDIPDDCVAASVIKAIDGAVRVSDSLFVGKFAKGALDKSMLSTGAKTILNIMQNPSMCFSTKECGDNALVCLKYVTEGNALVESCGRPYVDDPECDIMLNGKHYTDFNEVMNIVYYKEGTGEYDEGV